MSIHSASLKTLELLNLTKRDIAERTSSAISDILAHPSAERDARFEAMRSAFPGVLMPVKDARKPENVDYFTAPYSTCQIFEPQESDLFFVASDIHGDLESLVACADRVLAECENASTQGKKPVLVILGDLIDRGPDSAECIAFLLRVALGKDEQRQGLRVLLVRGDHDIALVCSKDGRIKAAVSPADFAEQFPDDVSSELLKSPDADLARAFYRFVRVCCPASVWFSNGILMAHGAVPHSDYQVRIGIDLTLWSSVCAQDYSWGRLRTDLTKRNPNRFSKTHEMGIENFRTFIELLNFYSQNLQQIGFPAVTPVSVFINGHQHCENGYLRCEVQLPNEKKCWIHNLTSFTERNAADEIIKPSYLLQLNGLEVVPLQINTKGERWVDESAAQSSVLSACDIESDSSRSLETVDSVQKEPNGENVLKGILEEQERDEGTEGGGVVSQTTGNDQKIPRETDDESTEPTECESVTSASNEGDAPKSEPENFETASVGIATSKHESATSASNEGDASKSEPENSETVSGEIATSKRESVASASIEGDAPKIKPGNSEEASVGIATSKRESATSASMEGDAPGSGHEKSETVCGEIATSKCESVTSASIEGDAPGSGHEKSESVSGEG